MTKAEKIQLVSELTETMKEFPNFYITDSGQMDVELVNSLRRRCFDANIQMRMVKNTLIQKALENLEGDFEEVNDALKQPSFMFFATAENPSVPAKVLKDFIKENNRPTLKAAVIETSVFKGKDQLEALASLKSKDELVGEIIGLLQSPAKNVISALKSSGGKLAGIIQTLSEREGA
ncbi:MAG: 50S ribosomal protein L10 [Bacteroidota bacterium]